MTDLPVGGTTGCDHGDNPSISEAGRWLATVPRDKHPSPIVPHLQRTFGLTVAEACAAIREATLINARAN